MQKAQHAKTLSLSERRFVAWPELTATTQAMLQYSRQRRGFRFLQMNLETKTLILALEQVSRDRTSDQNKTETVNFWSTSKHSPPATVSTPITLRKELKRLYWQMFLAHNAIQQTTLASKLLSTINTSNC